MRKLNILNLGAGVQSTTLYLLSLRREEPEFVPQFDYAIFADTQEEPQAVYEHLDWLKSLNGPPILIATAGKLGDDLQHGVNSTGQRFASIPAFTRGPSDVREGRLRRHCTRDYKINVVERVIRRELLGLQPKFPIPKDVTITQYLGLSYDESGRVASAKKRYEGKHGFKPAFPLWEMEWTRSDCEAYLRDVAPGRKIAKSACVFCPYHDNATWRRMRDQDRPSWDRAVEIDRALRTDALAMKSMERPIFLHRSCVPLEEAKIDEPVSNYEQHLFGFAAECDGMCGN